jgi:hypothetical protein
VEDTGISDQVTHFLDDHISSVAQLETLLLLQTNPQQKWTSADLSREFRTEILGTERQLQSLLDSRLLKKDDAATYFYAPASDALHAAVIALAQAYVIRRITIISLIFAKPSDNLRAFSDAFRLRKDPPK